MRALACLASGLLLLVLGLVLALSHQEPRRTGSNGVWASEGLGSGEAGFQACQSGELLPAGTGAVQLELLASATPGPAVAVELRRHGRVIARGSATTDAEDQAAVAPIAPAPRKDLDDVDVCLTVGEGGQVLMIGGRALPGGGHAQLRGRTLKTALPLTYLHADGESWWSSAGRVADRMALGRGDWGGGWIAWAVGLLVLAALGLTVRALLIGVALAQRTPPPAANTAATGRVRGLLRRIPAQAWTIAAIAILNAAAWSLITPAFQVPDEQTHVAYAQLIGERGRPPLPRAQETFAPELQTAMDHLRFGALGARTFDVVVWSPRQQAQLDSALHADLPRTAGDEAGPAAPEPPLYYALEAIPYKLASSATLLDRIALMRLLSALMAGATALLVFLFVRECLPGRPWAWTVGGLGAALVPLLGFVSGGVNPDALLFPVSAALLLCLARAFRRGLTTRLAVWTGIVLALGVIAKINFYGLLPGAFVALALAARTSGGGWSRTARLLGIAAGIALVPYLLLTALDALVWDRTFILARTPAEAPEDHGNLLGQLSYLWQVYLPRLPGQDVAFPEFTPTYEVWLKGFVGRFGWLTASFSNWAYRVAAVLLGATLLLALRGAWAARDQLRRRLPELAGYAAVAGGLLLMIGMVALRGWAPGINGAVQGRYLLPLLGLFAALLALAARGAGERWGRTVGVAIVLTCVGWSLFAQLLTIAWFYG